MEGEKSMDFINSISPLLKDKIVIVKDRSLSSNISFRIKYSLGLGNWSTIYINFT